MCNAFFTTFAFRIFELADHQHRWIKSSRSWQMLFGHIWICAPYSSFLIWMLLSHFPIRLHKFPLWLLLTSNWELIASCFSSNNICKIKFTSWWLLNGDRMCSTKSIPGGTNSCFIFMVFNVLTRWAEADYTLLCHICLLVLRLIYSCTVPFSCAHECYKQGSRCAYWYCSAFWKSLIGGSLIIFLLSLWKLCAVLLIVVHWP